MKVKAWINILANDGSVHTMPVEDDVEHETILSCVCGPSVEVYSNAPSRTLPGQGWLVIHQALDSRP